MASTTLSSLSTTQPNMAHEYGVAVPCPAYAFIDGDPVYWQDIDANLAENLAWCRRQQHMMSIYLPQYGQRFDRTVWINAWWHCQMTSPNT